MEGIMVRHTSLTLAAALLATTFAAASAQTAQDHAAHHPAEPQAATDATSPPTGFQGGTTAMGQNGGGMPMGNVGTMMGGGMMGGQAGSAMAPLAHTEGRIAFIKAELSITDAQAPQWNTFADALRGASKAMRETMSSTMQADTPSNAADRTDAMVKMMSARLESMKSIAAAEKSLYAVLTDAQKKTADELLSGPMMGGPMMGISRTN
jgi:LTXXQ motif family protein